MTGIFILIAVVLVVTQMGGGDETQGVPYDPSIPGSQTGDQYWGPPTGGIIPDSTGQYPMPQPYGPPAGVEGLPAGYQSGGYAPQQSPAPSGPLPKPPEIGGAPTPNCVTGGQPGVRDSMGRCVAIGFPTPKSIRERAAEVLQKYPRSGPGSGERKPTGFYSGGTTAEEQQQASPSTGGLSTGSVLTFLNKRRAPAKKDPNTGNINPTR